MRECCGTCQFNRKDNTRPRSNKVTEYCCGNEDSENYGIPTRYDDVCYDWEEKE